MKAQLVIPAIACIVILLTIYHLEAARRNFRQSDDAWQITVRVRNQYVASATVDLEH
jgi:hypothetical protein